MTEDQNNYQPDDLLAPEDLSAPTQLAMHGLLGEYLEPSKTDDEFAHLVRNRIVTTCATGFQSVVSPPAPASVGPANSRWFLFTHLNHLLHHRRILTFSALAAALLIAVGLLWQSPRAVADIYSDAANAGSIWFRLAGSAEFVLNPDSEEAKNAREKLNGYERHVREGLAHPIPQNDPEIGSLCVAWQLYYCLLRDLGLGVDAIREAKAAVEFSKSRPEHPYREVFQDGLGNVCSAFGQIEEARKAYLESIEVRRNKFSIDWKKDPHYGEPGYEGHLGHGIVPAYLRLMLLGIAEKRLPEARAQFTLAERAMAQRLRTICELFQINVSESVSLWDLWLAVPEAYRTPKKYSEAEMNAWPNVYLPSASCPAWMRALLYHQAVLLRAEKKYAEAEVALDRASKVEDHPDSDEFHLPFVESLERARIAIIRKDYSAALKAVQYARAYMNDPMSRNTDAGPEVNKLPISAVQAAEMNLLEGVARLGRDPNDPQGRTRIGKACTLIEHLAMSLPSDQQNNFLSRFDDWRKLVEKPL